MDVDNDREPRRGERYIVPHTTKLAIVAALEREVRPLVKNWRVSHNTYADRTYKFHEAQNAVLVCGGIGAECARRATEAVIALYQPRIVISAGFAGALHSQLAVADIIRPARIINASDGSVSEAEGNGTLLTFPSIADAAQKSKLARAYNADAVDMEAAAVARGAEARGVHFAAVKAISDASDCQLPPMDRFVTHDGRFRSGKFLMFAMLRPWLWPSVIRLGRNSSRAAEALARALNSYLQNPETLEKSPVDRHPMKKVKV